MFTNKGRVYWLKVYKIPDLARTSRGRAVVNLLELQPDEKILTTIQVRDFDDRFVVFASKRGIVKKTELTAFARPKKTGIIAVGIGEDDELMGVELVSGGDDVVVGTRNGMAIRFNEEDARVMGRTARGVKGIELTGDDEAVGLAVAIDEGSLFTVCENGYGKKTRFSEYRRQKRGGKGLIDIRTTDRNGKVVATLAVSAGDDVMMMTSGGMLVRISTDDLRDIGRNTQGVRVIRVKDEDKVVGAEKVDPDKDENSSDEDENSPSPDVGENLDADSPSSRNEEEGVDSDAEE